MALNGFRRQAAVAWWGALIGVLLNLAAAAQTAQMPVIGVLSPFLDANSTLLSDFRAGLRQYGYEEGRNILIEYRSAEGHIERLQPLAGELVGRPVDVLVTTSAPAVHALRQATNRIPIVMARVGDAVEQGFVASLAQPGGNITGASWLAPELSAKRLEILKSAFPGIARVAVLREASAGAASAIATEAAARRLGVRVQLLQARTADELEEAFAAITASHAEAIDILEGLMIFNNTAALAGLARQSGLPAIASDAAFAEAGGLMSYGPNFATMHRRAAYFVDRILRGTPAGVLPVEQPTEIELVINLATARALGLTISPATLLRADRLIE